MKKKKLANEQTLKAWDNNASFWDQKMGEGNDFVNLLIWPALERLLKPVEGEQILDIACGNGLTSRRLAANGAHVVAFDFSKELIKYARIRTSEYSDQIEYKVVDATDKSALLKLGRKRYDAAICNMALFDIADIIPLLQALPNLLKPAGRFVFSILHPCFNNRGMAHVAEMEDKAGKLTMKYAVKIWSYMSSTVAHGIAITGQPKPHLYFHRPLQEIFGVCFKSGFVLDGFEECAFPKGHRGGSTPLSWNGNFSEIPPVLVARMILQ